MATSRPSSIPPSTATCRASISLARSLSVTGCSSRPHATWPSSTERASPRTPTASWFRSCRWTLWSANRRDQKSLGLLRGRDTITPYMYLPPLSGVFEGEQVACLFRPALVSDELLRHPPRRVAQLLPPARRQLKVKLAAYWGRATINAEDLPLHERDEDEAARPAGLQAPTIELPMILSVHR